MSEGQALGRGSNRQESRGQGTNIEGALDHYAPTPDLVRPWRTRTMIATAVAVVELVALVAVGVILLGKGWFAHARASAVQQARTNAQAVHHPAKKTTVSAAGPDTPAQPIRPVLSRAKTPIMVLNGNGHDGAAGTEAKILRVLGYPIAAVGNATRSDYGRDIAMYLPGYDREARRLARDESIPVVAPLDGLQPSQLRGAKIAVIVGAR